MFTKEIVSRKKNVLRGDRVKEEKIISEEIVSRKKNIFRGDDVKE